jgi:anaphase-promoting complex subunit 8
MSFQTTFTQRDDVHAQLRRAVVDCSSRGLTSAAKWHLPPSKSKQSRAAEQLNGMASVPIHQETMTVDTNAYLLAKCYFDAREYERAAHVLRGKDDHKSIFLQCYATYLAGEKLKAESSYDAAGIHTRRS